MFGFDLMRFEKFVVFCLCIKAIHQQHRSHTEYSEEREKKRHPNALYHNLQSINLDFDLIFLTLVVAFSSFV